MINILVIMTLKIFILISLTRQKNQ